MTAKERMLKQVLTSIKNWNPSNGEFVMEVIPDDIKRHDNWWYVPVCPKPSPKHISRFIDAISEMEIELQDEKHLKVDIVPAFLDDAPAVHSRPAKQGRQLEQTPDAKQRSPRISSSNVEIR